MAVRYSSQIWRVLIQGVLGGRDRTKSKRSQRMGPVMGKCFLKVRLCVEQQCCTVRIVDQARLGKSFVEQKILSSTPIVAEYIPTDRYPNNALEYSEDIFAEYNCIGDITTKSPDFARFENRAVQITNIITKANICHSRYSIRPIRCVDRSSLNIIAYEYIFHAQTECLPTALVLPIDLGHSTMGISIR